MSGTPGKGKGMLPLLLVFFTVFIDLIGFGVIIPLLPTFAEKFGADPFQVGLLVMSYSLMQFFFTPIWGRLSDRVGRRPILLLSLAASASGYLIWGFAGSLSMLFLSRLVAGTGNANIAVAQAYIADVTTPENRAKGMGLVGAAFGLGFILGPAIGGLCGQHSYHLAGFVAAGFSLLDLLLTFFFLPEPEKRSQAGHERFSLSPAFYLRTLSDRRYRLSLAIFFLSTFAFANMEATLVLLTERQFAFDARANGLMFAYIGLVMVIMQGGLIGRLSRRFGEKRLVLAGSATVALGLALTPAGHGLLLLYLSLACLGVGAGMNTPANQSILSRQAPGDSQGGVLGIGQSLSTLGRIAGPLVGGAAFQYLGMGVPYLIGALSMVACFILAIWLPAQPASGSSENTTERAEPAGVGECERQPAKQLSAD